MSNKLKTLLFSFVLVVLLMILLVAPDIIYSWVSPTFKLSRDPRSLLLLIPLSIGFLLCPSKLVIYALLSFFSAAQIIQFIHIAYFNSRLSPFALLLLKVEYEDVFSEGLKIWKQFWYIFPMILLPYSLIGYICNAIKCRKSWISMIFLCAPVLWIGTSSWIRKNDTGFTPNPVQITLDNSIKSIIGFIILQHRNFKIKDYKPYKIHKKDPLQGPVNIVLIIGESVNYNHMSLFGYKKNDTTPNLNQLAKNDNFIYKKGISGAICTLSSCKFLTNVVYEPDNIRQTHSEETNVFKLAKEAGFKTFYLSSQSGHLLLSVGGADYIDHLMTAEMSPRRVLNLGDLYLIENLKNQPWGEKNFIVLHQRSIHSPYRINWGTYQPKVIFNNNSEKILNDYDNAMLYNDYLISEMFNFFNQSSNPFYIIWTSDHSELLGENGVFGHGSGRIYPEIGNVPVLVQSNDSEFLKKIDDIFAPTHYEIAKCISSLLGYEVENPNEEPNVFYLNGIDFSGKMGYLRGVKDPKTETIQYSQPIFP